MHAKRVGSQIVVGCQLLRQPLAAVRGKPKRVLRMRRRDRDPELRRVILLAALFVDADVYEQRISPAHQVALAA